MAEIMSTGFSILYGERQKGQRIQMFLLLQNGGGLTLSASLECKFSLHSLAVFFGFQHSELTLSLMSEDVELAIVPSGFTWVYLP